MRTIGMIGGMSWASSAEYYRLVNEAVKERLGGLHSARVALYSVDFDEVAACQREARWDDAARILADAAGRVARAGARCVVLCTNTMHRVADAVQAAVDVPLLHIADATAEAVREAGVGTVGLLGTRFTMEQDFYRGRLEEQFGLTVLVPPKPDRDLVHRVIYEELCLGQVKDASRREYLRIMDDLHAQGAEGIIEGCTEIVMLVQQSHTDIPLFDTTAIHAEEAVVEAVG